MVVARLRRLFATASSAALPIVLNGLEELPGFESEPEVASTKTLCSPTGAISVSATGALPVCGERSVRRCIRRERSTAHTAEQKKPYAAPKESIHRAFISAKLRAGYP